MTLPGVLATACGIAAVPLVFVAFGSADFEMLQAQGDVVRSGSDTLTRDLVASAGAAVLLLLAIAFYSWHGRIVRDRDGRGLHRHFSR